jgi:hypothetical protein
MYHIAFDDGEPLHLICRRYTNKSARDILMFKYVQDYSCIELHRSEDQLLC